MKSLLREPLFHFILIGTALFLVFELFDDPTGTQSQRIVVTNGQVEFLKAGFARSRQRQPTPDELQGLVDAHVREEVLYRAALALGLDKNDQVVRRRLRQKIELMGDDIAGITVPTDEDLRQFIQRNPAGFMTEAKVSFRQIFIDAAQRGMAADSEAERLLALVSGQGKTPDPEALGDRLMLPRSFQLSPISEIEKLFGKAFSRKLADLEPGRWSGPVPSGYGLHLVLVSRYVPGRLPELDAIREAVEWEWSTTRRKALREELYEEIKKKYTIEFEEPVTEAASTRKVSVARTAPGVQR